MESYILSIDQSTSGTKAILFDKNGRLVLRRNEDHKQYYPKPGWVEHDPMEILNKTLIAINQVLMDGRVLPSQIQAMGISNQRETVVVWDRRTGLPVYNAIVWQCSRGEKICAALATPQVKEMVQQKTGLILSPYFCASKIKWILDEVEGARKAAEEGHLAFGTIDSWLIYKLTGGRVHACDISNASRTQLYNIYEQKWDPELFQLFTIPESMAPKVCASDDNFGEITVGPLSCHVSIQGVLGDSHGALFGQQCYEAGMTKVTYGTGSSIMMNIGDKPYTSKKGLVTSIGWKYRGAVNYVAEGNVNCSGAVLKWLTKNLGILPDSQASQEMALSVPDNAGVYMVPAFAGLGAPYWSSDSSAVISGLTYSANKNHLVRAALESMAYQDEDILSIMKEESGVPDLEIRVDGGPTRNRFLMQFQADIACVRVLVKEIEEVSALGAAYMAGLSCGFWEDLEQIRSLPGNVVLYEPSMDEETRARLIQGWKKAVERTLV